jgi:hypothetical protein
MNPEEAAQPGPVLDTRLRGKQLHADPRVITFGRQSMALDEVEWVAYWAAHTATKRFLSPTTHDSQYNFEVGKDPYPVGPRLIVHEYVPGKSEDVPEAWTFLVDLANRYLVPRLLTGLVDRVRSGETVTVAGSVKVSLDGIACRKPKVSATWQSITRVQPYNGTVWVYQQGIEAPVLTVPMGHPNAVLMPALFAAFTS